MTTTLLQPKISPSKHPHAEIIHHLEAGGSMLPDTPENLMQIIGIYSLRCADGLLLARFTLHC
jgi:hypothetical protein